MVDEGAKPATLSGGGRHLLMATIGDVRQSAQASELTRPLAAPRNDAAKSALDITLSIAALILALPVMALVAVAIYLDSGRPIFFVQERCGRQRQTFRMYKFRTLERDHDTSPDREYMRAFVRGEGQPSQQGEENARSWIHKPFDKGQVTRVGRLLRRTSLDELPQLFNVLRREMSLVGPRPNVLSEVEAYHDWHYARLQVLPGITGLAQVRGRSAICFDDIVRHDLEYIERQSLKLDLKILWWTIMSIVVGQGAQ